MPKSEKNKEEKPIKEEKLQENLEKEINKNSKIEDLEDINKTQESFEIDTNSKYFEMENKYLRLLAEMENTRKRLQKEKQETVSFAIENTISDFLNIFDNFENALGFASSSNDEVKNWAKGFEMILTQFRDILHSHGIVAFHSEGNIFDPHFHEAVEIIETNDYPDGSIMQEFSKGYKSKNRTIRAAKVKVARNIIEKKDEEKDEKSIETQNKEDKDENLVQENKS
ncbi:MAG: nucleotide exchange factor GrpE [Nanoarchaeota archaeon]|jgi:molecular chaperone GrpE|nr:nucleotide exchange factor GrpE [Nanoarchaeota archaeon]